MKQSKSFSITTKNKVLLMEWIRTPKIIWYNLSKEFNFTVDACASDKNHLLPKYWTINNSALDQNWDNEIVYCHPMYDIYIPKFDKIDLFSFYPSGHQLILDCWSISYILWYS